MNVWIARKSKRNERKYKDLHSLSILQLSLSKNAEKPSEKWNLDLFFWLNRDELKQGFSGPFERPSNALQTVLRTVHRTRKIDSASLRTRKIDSASLRTPSVWSASDVPFELTDTPFERYAPPFERVTSIARVDADVIAVRTLDSSVRTVHVAWPVFSF